MDILRWIVREILLQRKLVQTLARNQKVLERELAQVDQEMRERLDAASTRVAARLDTLLDKVEALSVDRQGAIDQALLEDAQRDADALRPSVEFLERLGSSDSEISPEVDPVPADSAGVENPPVIEGPAPVAPSEGPITNESEEEAAQDESASSDSSSSDSSTQNTSNN